MAGGIAAVVEGKPLQLVPAALLALGIAHLSQDWGKMAVINITPQGASAKEALVIEERLLAGMTNVTADALTRDIAANIRNRAMHVSSTQADGPVEDANIRYTRQIAEQAASVMVMAIHDRKLSNGGTLTEDGMRAREALADVLIGHASKALGQRVNGVQPEVQLIDVATGTVVPSDLALIKGLETTVTQGAGEDVATHVANIRDEHIAPTETESSRRTVHHIATSHRVLTILGNERKTDTLQIGAELRGDMIKAMGAAYNPSKTVERSQQR